MSCLRCNRKVRLRKLLKRRKSVILLIVLIEKSLKFVEKIEDTVRERWIIKVKNSIRSGFFSVSFRVLISPLRFYFRLNKFNLILFLDLPSRFGSLLETDSNWISCIPRQITYTVLEKDCFQAW